MFHLVNQIVRISARRDRTEINSAMVDALTELFQPQRLTISRCYQGSKKAVLFACAGFDETGPFLRNAYLPDHRYCQPPEHDPLVLRCLQEASPVMALLPNNAHRIIFPVPQTDQPRYLIDISLPENLSADKRIALMGLIEYFGNHLSLLDYGEEDTLTGLASRKTFDKHLFELLGKAAADEPLNSPSEQRRQGNTTGSHWIAVCDIDHFKSVNDTYGHLIGDEVLIMLAQVMRHSFRFDDQLFRFGGEEFITLLQPTNQEFAQNALERFRKNIEKQTFSRVGNITVSIGFSALLPHDTPTDAIDRADEALYYAKHHGRNRVECYEQLVADGNLAAKTIEKGEIELF